MRFFNTAGPVNPEDHYMLSPLARINIEQLLGLIKQKKYFVLHAPRQTGKTSCLLALRDYLNGTQQYRVLYVNVEDAQSAREDVHGGIRAIMNAFAQQAEFVLQEAQWKKRFPEILEGAGAHGALGTLLSEWTQASPVPTILLLDEIDALIGDTLIAVLRQLRSGYTQRPQAFPQSVVLCGVRDVRDYRIHSAAGKEIITGGSAFNIKAESLRLGDFTQADIAELYAQHSVETGQAFTAEALALAWELTCGQPWLVNALAYETTFKLAEGRDRTHAITAALMLTAKENLIVRRETHLDQLTDKLKEDRVRRVIAPLLAGEAFEEDFQYEHVQYVIDLGLVRQELGGALHIANKIYQEIIPRELAWGAQTGLSIQSAWYIGLDGRLQMEKLFLEFQQFFREHSEHWVERFSYKEAGPQLLLQAFLQRIVNGGGRIEREYGLGRKRTDLLIVWPTPGGVVQRVVIEVKILHRTLAATLAEGLGQTRAYMDLCGTREGHLVIFDRTAERPWEEKIFQRTEMVEGLAITVWGM